MPRITLLFAALHVLLMLVLTWRVVGRRRALQIGLGSGGDQVLERAIRAHANFTEYVPMALLMLGLLELSGVAAMWLWAFGALLLVGRVLHAQGLSGKSGYSVGRFYGAASTLLVMAGMAVLGLVRWFMSV